MSTEIKKALILNVAEADEGPFNKITIVGAGKVGIAVAMSLLTQGITKEICILDTNESVLLGEIYDIQHGSSFLNNAKIYGGVDFELSANSSIVVITAGASPNADEPPLMLIQRNADIMRSVIPKIMDSNRDPIIVLITQPTEIMAYIAWKFSGLPKNRVIGTGTTLDSARFTAHIAQRTGVAPGSCFGLIIGEQGENSLPLWSGVTVGGARLIDHHPLIGTDKDPEHWNELHRKVVSAGADIINLKGHNNWGVALSLAAICKAILQNSNTVFPVTTSIKGKYGIEKDIFLSVPAVLNNSGASAYVNLPLQPKELEHMKRSAKHIGELQETIKF